ncbi:MAG: SPFH domain-containing protein [Phycisphaera sp.]|nr:MAG: SPFH domain-containing protein [Phycisphaera sp.]
MSGDFNTYKRAASHSILGLVFQGVFGVGLLVYGIVGREPTAITGAIFALIGLLPWIVLLILFDQHRRERIEAMEAEAFAATDAATSSVFDEAEGGLRVAGRRLKLVRTIAIPAIGLVFGAALILAGALRVLPGRELADPDNFVAPPHELVGLTIGLAVAVIGFMFSRYTAGMAKRPAWQALQGGATIAAGTALFGLLIGVGHVVDQLGTNDVIRAMLYVSPVLLVVFGAEAILNFLLELYRPRKPDEGFRPPFASRLLGPVAAPEMVAESVSGAIDYQFGYEVSRSWMYRLLTRRAWVLVLFAGLLVWFMSAFVVVRPDQKGIHTRFGRVVQANVQPGLRPKLPWPIDRIEVPGFYERDDNRQPRLTGYSTSTVREILGASAKRAIDVNAYLWTNLQAENESTMLVQPSRGEVEAGSEVEFGRDLSMLRVEVPVRYTIDDVEAWDLFTQDGAHLDMLDRLTQKVVMRYLVRTRVDELLGAKRAEMAGEIRERLEREFIAANPKQNGEPVVRILSVGVAGVSPPAAVALQFGQVVEQEQKYQAQLNAAQAEAIRSLTEVVGSVELADEIVAEIDALGRLQAQRDAELDEQLEDSIIEQELKIDGLLADAGGQAASLIADAQAQRWERHMGQWGEAQLAMGQATADRANRPYFRAQLYLERFFSALDGKRVMIVPGGGIVSIEFDGTHDRQSGAVLQDDFSPSSGDN